ncbi:MAG TPA: peptidoglycan editing factor PgeF [bacterium]|nr:peptidoglycan editing factor PgeF [bacterium]
MNPPRLLFSHHLRAAGAVHAFTTRQGGEDGGRSQSFNLGRGAGADRKVVAQNRSHVLAALGMADAMQVEASQVHGATVAVVGRGDAGEVITGADGLVTAERGVMLAVHSADCVPLLLADPSHHVVAAVHAGWRGLVTGIAAEAVTVMADRFGCRPADLRVAIGPCIGPCHYEVDEPVIARLQKWPWWEAVVTANPRGRWQLDLREATRRQLGGRGVPLIQIETLDWCTFEHPELFYSYRRDGSGGRMEAVIGQR